MTIKTLCKETTVVFLTGFFPIILSLLFAASIQGDHCIAHVCFSAGDFYANIFLIAVFGSFLYAILCNLGNYVMYFKSL